VSQKLPFNNITAQPLIPLVSNEAVLFHRLTDADANALWALHMWVAPNSTISSDAEQANLIVYATPRCVFSAIATQLRSPMATRRWATRTR
jgi:uncharacterized membrane protein YhaH (DUF805 family)